MATFAEDEHMRRNIVRIGKVYNNGQLLWTTFTNLQFKPKLPPRQSLPIKSPGQVVLTCRRLPRRAQKCMCQSARPRQKGEVYSCVWWMH
eukprot:1158083-Pelagomonas_calceolata.AAC.1